MSGYAAGECTSYRSRCSFSHAGSTDHAPFPSSIAIAGISSDHTDAATITPDAKPSNVFCNRTDISPFMKNTKAEPSIVPSNGISNPMINVVVIFYLPFNQLS